MVSCGNSVATIPYEFRLRTKLAILSFCIFKSEIGWFNRRLARASGEDPLSWVAMRCCRFARADWCFG